MNASPGRYAFRGCLVIVLAALAGCGFHLRRSAQLPAGMQRMHINLSGDTQLRRGLQRALKTSGVQLVDTSGPGVAELNIPQAGFRTDALTLSGRARISEYAVRYHVTFNATDADGSLLVKQQDINMSREFTYDARQAVGTATQVAQLEDSMRQDMVRAILFRLQAAGRHSAAPAVAASAAR